MRLGIEKSKGEYVAFCESDDYIREDYIQKKVEIINRYENVGIISNAIKMFGNQKDIEVRGWVCQHIRKLLKQGGTPVDLRYNQDFNFIPTLSSVMIRRDILMELDYNTPIPAWIDFWLYRQILIKYVLYFVDEELTFWRQHESFNGLENSSKIYNQLADFLEKSNKLIGL
jgi:glycosyltransferase involved in cell wall biosynthesis